jgi:hypothetical protein
MAVHLSLGIGDPIRQVNGATDSTLVSPHIFNIPAGGYSEAIGAGDCIEQVWTIEVKGGGGIITPQIGASQNSQAFTDITDDASPIPIPATPTTTVTLSYIISCGGFVRMRNTSTEPMKAWCNKRIL